MRFDQVVSDIYLAGAGLQAWLPALEGVAKLTGSQHAMMQSFTVQDGQMGLSYSLDNGTIDASDMAYYVSFIEEFGDIRVAATLQQPKGTIVQDLNFISEQEMNHHPYYADVLLRTGLRYAACVSFQSNANKLFGISLQRTKHQGPVAGEQLQNLQRLIFHTQQATRIEDSVNAQSHQSSNSPMQALPASACIVSSNGVIVSEGDRLASIHAEILSVRGAIKFKHPQVHEAFMRKLNAACSGIVQSMELIESKKRIWFYPAPNGEGVYFPMNRIVLLIDDIPSNSLLVSTFVTKYGLTKSEVEIAQLLVDGHGTKTIATIRQVSPHTVRSQLKSIYAKLGVHSQAETVALVSRLRTPLP